jgi:predicted lactoylglutathione lyase
VDRVARVIVESGGRDVDGPPGFDDRYYACFFDDPDGNKLEICYLPD